MSDIDQRGRSQTLIPFFRKAALFEGVTLILLMCIAVPIKNLTSLPGLTHIIGPIHGLAFFVFLYAVIESWAAGDVTPRWVFAALVACLFPSGTFLLLYFYDRNAASSAIEEGTGV